jgi:hypothetical protein
MQKRIAARSGIWTAAIVMATLLQGSTVHAQEFSQILRGYEIAPVHLNLKGKDWQLVGLGSYLVNTTGCNDCHTWLNWADGHNPYLPNQQPEQINTLGYMAGGRPFGADVVNPKIQVFSANITPDAQGRPAGLTLKQFLDVMHTGNDPDDPTRKLKIMPWPLYRWKTDRELIAIYEYLRAIPSIPAN